MFDPLALGPGTAPDRLFFSPTSVGYAPDGVLTPVATEHYGRRAASGAGVVMTEHFAVSEEGRQHRAGGTLPFLAPGWPLS